MSEDRRDISRLTANGLIEDTRRALAEFDRQPDRAKRILARLAAQFAAVGIEPLGICDDEAHGNAYVDHCYRCAPRWGYVGPFYQVSADRREPFKPRGV